MSKNRKILFFSFVFVSFSISIFANTNLYELQVQRVKQISALSKLIPDSSIGVIDAKGNYINEQDDSFGLCCSGYVKWIADGFYYPLRKKNHSVLRYLSIKELSKPNYLIRGNIDTLKYELTRQPFFGLDWTRNIANTIAYEKDNKILLATSHDVTRSVHAKYVKDRGFPIEKIPLILSEQAILHPERWYIASINGEFGENPTLIQHYHNAAFFAYYNKQNQFQLAVLERTRQTSFEYLLSRYKNHYCHLVWLDITGKFELTLP